MIYVSNFSQDYLKIVEPLLNDIALLADDVAATTKVAMKKTAGILSALIVGLFGGTLALVFVKIILKIKDN